MSGFKIFKISIKNKQIILCENMLKQNKTIRFINLFEQNKNVLI